MPSASAGLDSTNMIVPWDASCSSVPLVSERLTSARPLLDSSLMTRTRSSASTCPSTLRNTQSQDSSELLLDTLATKTEVNSLTPSESVHTVSFSLMSLRRLTAKCPTFFCSSLTKDVSLTPRDTRSTLETPSSSSPPTLVPTSSLRSPSTSPPPQCASRSWNRCATICLPSSSTVSTTSSSSTVSIARTCARSSISTSKTSTSSSSRRRSVSTSTIKLVSGSPMRDSTLPMVLVLSSASSSASSSTSLPPTSSTLPSARVISFRFPSRLREIVSSSPAEARSSQASTLMKTTMTLRNKTTLSCLFFLSFSPIFSTINHH
mmetsp:Transcript_40374/g.67477  ORF Transcript_40374/g.67477 Transcript_40374/m.67477 type:complete len:320 (-) Transcript_40374:18-977(-)